MRAASRDLPGGVLRDQVLAFIRMHPDMNDIDVALAFKWRINQFDALRIRQSVPGSSAVDQAIPSASSLRHGLA